LPIASSVPFDFVVDEAAGKTRVEFHFARGNALAELAARGGRWLIAVGGHDAYVSPDWYASSDQVPTWLYQQVHISGPIKVMDADLLPGHLDRLSQKFESWLSPKPVWTVDKVNPARREMLMKAIVGVTLEVESVEGNFKLNQHKGDADNVAIARALAQQNDIAAQAIAKQMIALRPQLNYE
jgi:transcriptional regulator